MSEQYFTFPCHLEWHFMKIWHFLSDIFNKDGYTGYSIERTNQKRLVYHVIKFCFRNIFTIWVGIMAAEKRMLCNELFRRCITIMQQIVANKRATWIKKLTLKKRKLLHLKLLHLRYDKLLTDWMKRILKLLSITSCGCTSWLWIHLMRRHWYLWILNCL